MLTTNSVNLPPYKLTNHLGVEVTIELFMGKDQIKSIMLRPNEVLPIDADTLRELRKRVLRDKSKKSQGLLDNFDNLHSHEQEEHRLGLLLTLRGERFTSAQPVPIDRVGSFPLEMISGNAGGGRFSRCIQSQLSSPIHIFMSEFHGTPPRRSNNTSNIPCIMVSISIKGDGGRDVVLNSIYSIKNDSSRALEVQLSIKGVVDSEDLSVGRGEEINIPLHMTHPFTTIKVRGPPAQQPCFPSSSTSFLFFLFNVSAR